jgi:hypothetical protein
VQTHLANNIASFFDGVVAATRCFNGEMPWWRGHARSEWKLHPSLHHKNLAANESNMAGRFSSHARVRHSSLHAPNDAAAKVFLMQHYGLPTRLLDWTESPLVALYFAVESMSHDDADATIWALAPTSLNETEAGTRHTFAIGNSTVATLFREVWQKPNNGQPEQQCLAINAEHIDVRQMVQSSVFTIHGRATPLQDFDGAERFLFSITIPACAKPGFRQACDLLHVNELYLFPDLEHLAMNIQRMSFADG